MAKMKNIQIALLSIALGFAACGEDATNEDGTETDGEVVEEVTFKNATVDEFGQTLIGAFKTGDVELFKQLGIDKEARIEYIRNTVQDDSIQQMLIQGIEGNPGIWEDFQFNDAAFNELVEQGGKLGVKWESVEFDGVDVNITDMEGMKQAQGRIIFSSNGKRYEFFIFECHEISDGWYGMGLGIEESMLQEEGAGDAQ